MTAHRRLVLALTLLLPAARLRAAEVEAGPAVAAPVAVAPAESAALLWSAAGLPSLDAPTWSGLQLHDAAAVYASSVFLDRLHGDASYRTALSAALSPHGDPSAITRSLASLARGRIAAAPIGADFAAQRVAALAPQAARPSAAGSLEDLSGRLESLGGAGDLDAALAALDLAFENSREGADPTRSLPIAIPNSRGPRLAPASEREPAAPAAPPAPAKPAPAKHALGLFDLVALGVNSIVGAGIFIKPAKMFGAAGVSSVFAFPITAMLVLPIALSFAEAGTYFHGKDGGSYQYTRGAFADHGLGRKAGEWASFSVTWLAWVALLFGWAAVTSVTAINLGYFVPALANPWAAKALSASVIAAISYINYRGVKEGARVSNAFALAKILPMLAFIAIGLGMLHPASLAHAAPASLAAISGASFMAFFALQGFENIAVPGGEVREPAKNIPRAVILSLGLASLVYAGIQLVTVGLTPHLATSAKPVVDAGYAMVGAVGAAVMALCAFFSTTGDSAAAALFGARFIKVLADDDHLPGSAAIRKIHPRHQTPHVAILLTSGLAIAALLLPLDTLMDVSSIAVAAQYLGTCLAIPFLRRRHAAPAGSFRLPGGPAIPILGAVSAVSLSAAGGFGSLSVDFALLGVGLALKAAWTLRKRKAPAA